MIDFIEQTARMIYKAIVIDLLILILDPTAIWALPFSIILVLCMEAKSLTKKKS